MSTNKTSNLGMHSWVASDPVRMHEFNENFSILDEAVASAVPKGVITAWSGAADAIPAGWALCNGENNTPDLRDRFLVGAGSSYAVGATGGAAIEGLEYFMSSTGTSTGYYTAFSRDYRTTGHDNRPPYYALCFIMKL